jgi:hypothetical protein
MYSIFFLFAAGGAMCVRSHWHRILQQPSLSFCCSDAPVICKSIRSRAC